MDIIDALILGLIQGLTEFLPVSSSGHLVLGETLLGLRVPGVTFEIWLHFGTLLAVVVYFRRQILKILTSIYPARHGKDHSGRMLLLALIAGTIPAVIIGVLFKSGIEKAFSSPQLAALMLLFTGIVLILSSWALNRSYQVNLSRGFIIGLAQAAAILPGISRSGTTISTAMFLGVESSAAAEFSFLLSIPAIGGAFLLDLFSTGGTVFQSDKLPTYLAGTVVSFIIGYLSIYYLLKIIRRGRFYLFGFYCLALGTVSLIYLT